MREPKKQMLGTMEPPLIQLSVNVEGVANCQKERKKKKKETVRK